MKELKFELLHEPENVVAFINDNNIKRSDILALIPEGEYYFTLFYYSDEQD